MSKELQALNRLGKDNGYDYTIEDFTRDYKLVEDGLKRLEKYENQKPKKKAKLKYIISFTKSFISPTTGREFPDNCTFCCSSLFANCIKCRFANENVKVYALIVKNRKTRKIIYQGNDYNEFRKVAEKYE